MHKLISEQELEFDDGNNKKYKIKAIKNSAVYAKELGKHLFGYTI